MQVIVTTLSPYLTGMRDPASNILLRRRTVYKQLRDTGTRRYFRRRLDGSIRASTRLTSEQFRSRGKSLYSAGQTLYFCGR